MTNVTRPPRISVPIVDPRLLISKKRSREFLGSVDAGAGGAVVIGKPPEKRYRVADLTRAPGLRRQLVVVSKRYATPPRRAPRRLRRRHRRGGRSRRAARAADAAVDARLRHHSRLGRALAAHRDALGVRHGVPLAVTIRTSSSSLSRSRRRRPRSRCRSPRWRSCSSRCSSPRARGPGPRRPGPGCSDRCRARWCSPRSPRASR